MTPDAPSIDIIAVSVGNTRQRVGVFLDGSLERVAATHAADPAPLAALLADHPRLPVVVASVNEPARRALVPTLAAADAYTIGDDLPVPIALALTDASTVGQDRLLDALAAHHHSGEACVVIDAGTAITVDFVDREGTFRGGAIAPGLRLMLAALHERTAALPLVEIDAVTLPPEPFGTDTAGALRAGVLAAARGLVHHLVDRYAQYHGSYPRVIATGGDAALLFERDEIVEHIVPDLTLMGIQLAARVALLEADDS